jgi:hypothetical protein
VGRRNKKDEIRKTRSMLREKREKIKTLKQNSNFV